MSSYRTDLGHAKIFFYAQFIRRQRSANSHTDGVGSVAVVTSHPVRLCHVIERQVLPSSGSDDDDVGRHTARSDSRRRRRPPDRRG